ncbi:MAG: hypothetical protein IKP58_01155 [Victivallales bacterium]|nr:hypothetical protein [Victivallales bacterium]
MAKATRIRFTVTFKSSSLKPEVKTNISNLTPKSIAEWQQQIYDVMSKTLLDRFARPSRTESNYQKPWNEGDEQ